MLKHDESICHCPKCRKFKWEYPKVSDKPKVGLLGSARYPVKIFYGEDGWNVQYRYSDEGMVYEMLLWNWEKLENA